MNKGVRGHHDFNCWAASTVIISLKYIIVFKAVNNITLRGIYICGQVIIIIIALPCPEYVVTFSKVKFHFQVKYFLFFFIYLHQFFLTLASFSLF